MSGMGYQIFSFVASVVSTMALTQIVYSWLKDAVPSAKMRALDALLFETEALLRSALEEGTIDYAQYESHFRNRIWAAKVRADQYRAAIYNINGRWHEMRYWLSGMSSKISAVMENLYSVRGQIAASSSRGRERLAKLGCTANPTLKKYSRRDTISNLVLPDAPANATVAVPPQPGTLMDANEDSAEADSTLALVYDVSSPSILHSSGVSSVAEQLPCASPVEIQAHAMPPLAFRSKETAGARRLERVVLHRFGKKSSSIDDAQSAFKERRGFPSPFRILSGFFHRSPTPPVSASATFSPAVLPEKGAYMQSTQWEENGHITLQVKLPV